MTSPSQKINLEEIRKELRYQQAQCELLRIAEPAIIDDMRKLISCVETMREALKSCKMGYHGMEECMEFNWDKVQEAKALFSDTEEKK